MPKVEFRIETGKMKRCAHQLQPLPESARPWRYKCALCGTLLKIASGMKLDMEPTTYFPECVGCGYCCKKAICVLGREVAGRCAELYWNDDQGRYRCRLAESEMAFALVLHIGLGCSSNLNSWRKEVKDRG